MRKLLIGFGVGVTALFNMHHSSAAPADDDFREAGAQLAGARGSLGPSVYDARGKPVGRYNPFGPTLLDVQGALIAVYPERDAEGGQYDAGAVRWSANGAALFYAAQDCAGTPLINNTTGGPPGTRPSALVRDSSGNLIAYIGAKGRSAAQSYRSWRDTQNGACTNVWGTPVPINTWALEKTVIINQLYPEPLTVK
ncbi:MAG: hypothetical protein V7642_2149 [Burkholderiales bacterium]